MLLPQQSHRLLAQLCGEGGSDPGRALSPSSNPRTLQCHLLWVRDTEGLEEWGNHNWPTLCQAIWAPSLAPLHPCEGL